MTAAANRRQQLVENAWPYLEPGFDAALKGLRGSRVAAAFSASTVGGATDGSSAVRKRLTAYQDVTTAVLRDAAAVKSASGTAHALAQSYVTAENEVLLTQILTPRKGQQTIPIQVPDAATHPGDVKRFAEALAARPELSRPFAIASAGMAPVGGEAPDGYSVAYNVLLPDGAQGPLIGYPAGLGAVFFGWAQRPAVTWDFVLPASPSGDEENSEQAKSVRLFVEATMVVLFHESFSCYRPA